MEQELPQIDYRSGMPIDTKTPNDLPVATWRCLEFAPGVKAGASDGVVGQGNDVQDGRFYVLGPSGRHRDVWQSLFWQG